MRLTLDSSDAPSSLALVSTGQRTVFVLNPPIGISGTALVDVLAVRPDGSTWLMGTVTAAAPLDHGVRVPLNPFTVAGPHLLLVEVNGKRLASSVTVSVVSAAARKKTAPTRRYLGRGQPVH
jgi:hypothetical protein